MKKSIKFKGILLSCLALIITLSLILTSCGRVTDAQIASKAFFDAADKSAHDKLNFSIEVKGGNSTVIKLPATIETSREFSGTKSTLKVKMSVGHIGKGIIGIVEKEIMKNLNDKLAQPDEGTEIVYTTEDGKKLPVSVKILDGLQIDHFSDISASFNIITDESKDKDMMKIELGDILLNDNIKRNIEVRIDGKEVNIEDFLKDHYREQVFNKGDKNLEEFEQLRNNYKKLTVIPIEKIKSKEISIDEAGVSNFRLNKDNYKLYMNNFIELATALLNARSALMKPLVSILIKGILGTESNEKTFKSDVKQILDVIQKNVTEQGRIRFKVDMKDGKADRVYAGIESIKATVSSADLIAQIKAKENTIDEETLNKALDVLKNGLKINIGLIEEVTNIKY